MPLLILLVALSAAFWGAYLMGGAAGLLWTAGIIGVSFYTAHFASYTTAVRGQTVNVENHFQEPPHDPDGPSRTGMQIPSED